MMTMNDDLKKALQSVKGSYPDFVLAIMILVKRNGHKDEVLNYLQNNPDVKTDKVIDYVESLI